jgi:Fungal specific transcription factor domain
VHDVESNKNTRRPSIIPNTEPRSPEAEYSFSASEVQTSWNPQNSPNGASSVANQILSNSPHDSQLAHPHFFANPLVQEQAENVSTLVPSISNLDYAMTSASGIPGDYNLFFDNFDTSNFYLPSTVFDSDLPISLWSRPDFGGNLENESISRRIPLARNENDALSRLGSRLPSLQPQEQDLMNSEPAPQADFLRAGPPWKISGEDHRQIQSSLNEFACVLPDSFSLPSRHTLSRFFEGYISGFHQHLPFLHIPTFSVAKCAPELFLAIAAVGAQYRFESTKGNKLWYAAKSIAAEQIRRRQSQHVADILSSPTPSRASLSKSPASHPSPETLHSTGHDNVHGSGTVAPPSDIR